MKKASKKSASKDICLSEIPVIEQRENGRFVLIENSAQSIQTPKLALDGVRLTVTKKGIKKIPKFKEKKEYMYLSKDVKDVAFKGYSNLYEIEGTIKGILDDLNAKLYDAKTPSKMYQRLRYLAFIVRNVKKGELKTQANKKKAYEMINLAISKLNQRSDTAYTNVNVTAKDASTLDIEEKTHFITVEKYNGKIILSLMDYEQGDVSEEKFESIGEFTKYIKSKFGKKWNKSTFEKIESFIDA